MGPQLDNPDSFGQFLRRERELREIKLEEIAAYTRIKLRALLAIEQDDFASLPPLAFVRAFVRCYADFIGLSIPDVMLRFDGFVQSRYPELTGEVPVIKSPRQPRQYYVVVLLVLVVAALVVLAWWMSRAPLQTPRSALPAVPGSGPIPGSTNGNLPATSDVLMPTGNPAVRPGATAGTVPGTTAAPGATAGPAAGETVPSPEAGPTLGPGATPEAAPAAGATPAAAGAAVAPLVQVTEAAGATAAIGPPSSSANLRPGVKHLAVLTVNAECWVGYNVDGAKKGEVLLRAGQTLRLEGRDSIRLIVGNPNALTAVHHNGAAVEFSAKCSPQHFNFPAGPDDKACYPRAAAPAGAAPTAPARPSAPASPRLPRPPAAAPQPENVPARTPARPRTPE